MGDIVVCVKNSYWLNKWSICSCPDLIVGKQYRTIKMVEKNPEIKTNYIWIENDIYNPSKIWIYEKCFFKTLKEIRKQKLERINENESLNIN